MEPLVKVQGVDAEDEVPMLAIVPPWRIPSRFWHMVALAKKDSGGGEKGRCWG